MVSRKIRKAIPAKLKALLQKEISSKCPFCVNEDVEHFNVHHIDCDRSNDHQGNLIMLCSICHSKIHNGDIAESTVRQRKLYLQNTNAGAAHTMGKVINFHSRVQGSVVGDHNIVTIKISKGSVNKYPEGCIGSDVIKNAYISYLITRYHEYKEYEVGKENMIYRIFPAALKKAFKIGATRTIYHLPDVRFEELASYIQSRIDKTKLAIINRSKGQHKNYDSFDEYSAVQGHPIS